MGSWNTPVLVLMLEKLRLLGFKTLNEIVNEILGLSMLQVA